MTKIWVCLDFGDLCSC